MLWHIWQAITLDLSSLIFQKFLQITGGREDIPRIAQEKNELKFWTGNSLRMDSKKNMFIN